MENNKNLTAEQIFQNHKEKFESMELTIFSKSEKFISIEKYKEYLIEGGLCAEIFNRCIENSLSISKQMLFHSLGKFLDKKDENKVKNLFIKGLNKLNIL